MSSRQISRIRRPLYATAKHLGDVQALTKAVEKRSFQPISNRIVMRLAGAISAGALAYLWRLLQ